MPSAAAKQPSVAGCCSGGKTGILRSSKAGDEAVCSPCMRQVVTANKKALPMWIPDWLYERLPLVYLAAGASCLFFFGLTLEGLPSAFLFFAAAVRTHMLRRLDRRAGPLRSKRRLPYVQDGKHRSPRYARH